MIAIMHPHAVTRREHGTDGSFGTSFSDAARYNDELYLWVFQKILLDVFFELFLDIIFKHICFIVARPRGKHKLISRCNVFDYLRFTDMTRNKLATNPINQPPAMRMSTALVIIRKL